MGLTVSDSGGGGDFAPCPEGTHVARCVRLIDLGMQPGSAQFPDPKHQVQFVWEVPDEVVIIGGEERPTLLTARYTASLHERARLRAILGSWRGRAFTEAELKGFELKNVLDVPCLITVMHSADGKYANVASVSKLPKGFPAPPRVSELVCYSIEDGHNDVYHSLSEKLRAAIDVGAGRVPNEPAKTSAPQVDTRRPGGELRAVTAAAAPRAPEAVPDFTDDDVPF